MQTRPGAPAHYCGLHHIKDIILPLHHTHTHAKEEEEDDDDEEKNLHLRRLLREISRAV